MSSITSPRLRLTVMVAMLAVVLLVGIPLPGIAQDGPPDAGQDIVEQLAEGQAIYASVCIACHQPDGMGIGDVFPALAGNALVTDDDPSYVITTVLNGRGGMPRFDSAYDDAQIAAAITWVRQAWDNDASPVAPKDVEDVRAQFVQTTPTPEGQVTSGPYIATPDTATPLPPGPPDATPDRPRS